MFQGLTPGVMGRMMDQGFEIVALLLSLANCVESFQEKTRVRISL